MALRCSPCSPRCLPAANKHLLRRRGEFGGGGVKAYQAYVVLDGCTVSNNTSAAGGGMQQDYVSPYGFPPGEVTITNSVFEGNVASQIGGGISAATSLSMTLQNVNFSGNLGVFLVPCKCTWGTAAAAASSNSPG